MVTTIQHDSKGWPYFDDSTGLVSEFPAYTRELSQKLLNSDADVATAINAAQRAEDAWNSLKSAMEWDVTTPVLTGTPAEVTVDNIVCQRRLGMCALSMRVNAPIPAGGGYMLGALPVGFTPALTYSGIVRSNGAIFSIDPSGSMQIYSSPSAWSGSATFTAHYILSTL